MKRSWIPLLPAVGRNSGVTRSERTTFVVVVVVVVMTSFLLTILSRPCQALVLKPRARSRIPFVSMASSSTRTVRLFSTLEEDTQGRRIRRKSNLDNEDRVPGEWNDDKEEEDGWGAPSLPTSKSRKNNNSNNNNDNDGWDANYTPKPRASRMGANPRSRGQLDRSNNYNNNNNYYNNGRSNNSNSRRDFSPRSRGRSNNNNNNNNNNGMFKPQTPGVRAINMNALEGAGFVHLYGLSSVLNALQANRRDLTTIQERWSEDEDAPEKYQEEEEEMEREAPKPQAQFRPYLFVQEQQGSTTRRGQKASDAERLLALAEKRNVPVAQVDKGILNTLSGNRPHQGFVLRCGKLYFESLSRIPMPGNEEDAPNLWLVLDEVVDPQNLGALLRSAYFLGHKGKMGIMVCSKNSAPPTPVVSAASAGALELATIYSTTNLPRTLNLAREDGFRIIGASSSVPSTTDDDDDPPPLYDLQDLPVSAADDNEDDRPVLLVLGSEGYGLRTLVAKACTEFVRIPSGMDVSSDSGTEQGVDSLNVSVTGGILLWHLLRARK